MELGWDELGVSRKGVDDEGRIGLSATMVAQRFLGLNDEGLSVDD